jgi:ABC-2 type transport system ATP-binding protein
VLSIKNVSKSYEKGSILALNDVSFEVGASEIFGLIGPDGAGKTSLFRIIATVLLADKGEITMNGLDVVRDYRQIRNELGYMPGKFSLYADLTVEENLDFFASIFNTSIEENYALIKDIYVQLEPFKTRRAGKLSGGMKQKLALCCALIHKPTLLLLDEPTTGVDPVSRKEFWDMLDALKKQGITILVSTPYMDEALRCDRIALLQHGRILQLDTPQGITARFGHPLWAIKGENMYSLLKDLRAWEQTNTCYAFGESHHLTLKEGNFNKKSIEDYLISKNHTSTEIMQIEAGVEDCFMALM